MRLQNYKNIEETQGNLLLVYAKSGEGKTATTLQTSEDPIVYLTGEGRKIKTTLEAIKRPNLQMKVGVYEGFSDLIDTVSDVSKFKGAKTIVLDSLTHIMMIHLADEILGENYNKLEKESKDEIDKVLTMQVKMSVEGYGTLAGQMNRLMGRLQGLTVAGFDVVCTARLEDRPKWNKAMIGAPALMGREFAKAMDGFFDFICLLETNHDAEGKIIYPPLASFVSPEDNFLAKWTGNMPEGGVYRRRFHVANTFRIANNLPILKGDDLYNLHTKGGEQDNKKTDIEL